MSTPLSSAERLAGLERVTPEGVAAHVVAAAVWAPSVHNTQPWLFSAGGQEIRLYADVSRQLMVADPDGREMMISCGAALFTARLALRSLGYIPDTGLGRSPVGTCAGPDGRPADPSGRYAGSRGSPPG